MFVRVVETAVISLSIVQVYSKENEGQKDHHINRTEKISYSICTEVLGEADRKLINNFANIKINSELPESTSNTTVPPRVLLELFFA